MFNSFDDKMMRIYRSAARKMPKDGSFTPSFITETTSRMSEQTKKRVLKTEISLDTLADFMLEILRIDRDHFDELLNTYMNDQNKVIEYERRNGHL